MSEPNKEIYYLKLSAGGNVVVGCVGIIVALISSSQAILLDGLFNLTYCATGLFTIKVALLVTGGDDERFPYGYAFFEPLVNGIKGMLVLGVSVMALVGSLQALLTGGRAIAAGLAIAYGIFASTVCWGAALLMRRGVKTTGSPLVKVDAENWLINAAISSCVLLAFAGIFVLREFGLEQFVPYVDPVVVLIVVVISIAVPIRMAWTALMALLNKAPDQAIVDQVTEIVDSCLAGMAIEERFIRVIQPGRQRMVMVHVVVPADYEPGPLKSLDALRQKTYLALNDAHPDTFVDMLFTTERSWGAPLSSGGLKSVTPP